MTLSGWYRSLRPYSFTASLVPVLIAPALALYSAMPVHWVIFPLFLLAALAFHAGTNVLNDYYDFANGVDRTGVADAAGVLVNGIATARFMRISGHLYFVLGGLLSLAIAMLQGWEILAVAAAGGGLAYLYTGKRISLKYYAAGDLLVFLLLGPAMAGAAFYSMTGELSWNAVYSGIIPGLLVTIILEANNIRDMDSDKEASVRTLAGMLGMGGARVLYVVLVCCLYAVVLLQWLAGAASAPVLIVAAAIPLSVRCVRDLFTAGGDRDKMAGVVMRSATLETLFGGLYIASFLSAAVVGL